MAERPEDLNLPNAVVSRIIREAMPDGVKVSKEANIAIAKAASVFVLYATSCSNQVASKSNRKTISSNDVIQAMKDMDFEKFVVPLQMNLEVWKRSQQRKKDSAAARKKEAANSTAAPDETVKSAAYSDSMECEDEEDLGEVSSTEENKENEENAANDVKDYVDDITEIAD